MSAEQTLSHIGLGGNVGDVFSAMQIALDTIAAHKACRVVAISKVYSTPPWGIEDQPDFLNCCASVETTLNAPDFLAFLQGIEIEGGRVRDVRWGPRTLDTDILTFGDQKLDLPGLTVPHPRMLERSFVMVPLADIAPDMMLEGKTVADHAKALNDSAIAVFDKVLEV